MNCYNSVASCYLVLTVIARLQVRQQSKNCRATQHELEMDMRSKECALGIDSMCHQLNNFSKVRASHALIQGWNLLTVMAQRPKVDLDLRNQMTPFFSAMFFHLISTASVQRYFGRPTGAPRVVPYMLGLERIVEFPYDGVTRSEQVFRLLGMS